jgi:hypothetical protein
LEVSLDNPLSVSSGCVAGEVVTVLPWSPTSVLVTPTVRTAVGLQDVEIVTIGHITEA